MKKKVELDKVTRLINHGPVVLVSSSYDDRMDITPVAWHMPVSKDPPTIALEIHEKHFIYECIKKTGDFVINIPSRASSEDIVRCGSCSGRDVDKFAANGLTPEPSATIKSPRLGEALAFMECVLVEDEYLAKKYNMVLGEVKYAEAEEEAFRDHWLFKRDDMKTVHHLGDRTFCFPDEGFIDLRKK